MVLEYINRVQQQCEYFLLIVINIDAELITIYLEGLFHLIAILDWKLLQLVCVNPCYSKCGPSSRGTSSASLRKLWEMWIWRPCPRPTESEFLGMGPKNLGFNKASLLKFENYWCKSYLKVNCGDSSGQTAWLCIVIVKFSRVGMLLSMRSSQG